MAIASMPRTIAVACLGLLPFACSSDPGSVDPDDGGPDGDGDGATPADAIPIDHALMPTVAHSGFDGTNTYKVPVYTTLEDAVFAIDDGSLATIEPVELPPELEKLGTFGKSWAMITTLDDGSTTFTASADGIDLEATLAVLPYDAAVVADGDERYNNPVNANETTRIACQDCHGAPGGVDHTPLAMSYRNDADLLTIIADGMYPEGGEVNGGDHVWDLTEAEAAGIVPYLRSLEPRGF